MRYLKILSLLAFLCALFLSNSVFAAAFQLYELGAPIIGSAAVGQAVVDDASISYYNPAGMAQLPSSQFMLGSQVILPYTNFSPNSQNTVTGNNGANAASLTPGMSVFYVYNRTPKLKLGVSLTAPYGGMLTYNDGWVGRYYVQSMTLYTLNLNPAIAYQFNKWAAIGIGASLEYANLHETVALPITPTIYGQANVKVDNFAPGYNIGLLLTPTKKTKIGIAYRSKITHDLSGNITFVTLTTTPNASTTMVMPQNVIASISQEVTRKITLSGELGWSNWSTMKDTVLYVANYSATTPLNWNNTYRAGLAGKFRYNNALLFQAGASYDSSPTNTSQRLPELPMDRQIRLGVGTMYSMLRGVDLGFSYEYINFGNASIYNTSSNGTLSGNYSRNYANVFQVSANISC